MASLESKLFSFSQRLWLPSLSRREVVWASAGKVPRVCGRHPARGGWLTRCLDRYCLGKGHRLIAIVRGWPPLVIGSVQQGYAVGVNINRVTRRRVVFALQLRCSPNSGFPYKSTLPLLTRPVPSRFPRRRRTTVSEKQQTVWSSKLQEIYLPR